MMNDERGDPLVGGKNADSTTKSLSARNRIDTVEVTSDSLTSRGGLALFVRYLRAISVYPHLERLFGSIARTAKGQPILRSLNSSSAFSWTARAGTWLFFDASRRMKDTRGPLRAKRGDALLSLR